MRAFLRALRAVSAPLGGYLQEKEFKYLYPGNILAEGIQSVFKTREKTITPKAWQ